MFGVLLDRTLESKRARAAAAAERAVRIDLLRVFSESTVASIPAHRGDDGWSAVRVARAEFVSEIAASHLLPEVSAGQLVAESRALVQSLPLTLAALRSGDISYRHAQALIGQCWSLPEAVWGDFERVVLPKAETQTVARFKSTARTARERLHPESILERRTKAFEERRVLLDPASDGMCWLSLYLPAEDAIAAYERITDIALALPEDEEIGGTGADSGSGAADSGVASSPSGAGGGSENPSSNSPPSPSALKRRTLAQRRADVARDLLIDGDTCDADQREADERGGEIFNAATADAATTQAAAEAAPGPHGTPARSRPSRRAPVGHGVRAAVNVTVPVLSMLGHTNEPATLEGYGPIDMETAKRLAGTATGFLRILTHPETGAVMSIGRTRHDPPPELRRALAFIDGTCRAVGCRTSARRCDIDHNRPYSENGSNGETSLINTAHLCQPHHRRKHHTRWRMENLGDGRIRWTSPSGKVYFTEPENQFDPVLVDPVLVDEIPVDVEQIRAAAARPRRRRARSRKRSDPASHRPSDPASHGTSDPASHQARDEGGGDLDDGPPSLF